MTVMRSRCFTTSFVWRGLHLRKTKGHQKPTSAGICFSLYNSNLKDEKTVVEAKTGPILYKDVSFVLSTFLYYMWGSSLHTVGYVIPGLSGSLRQINNSCVWILTCNQKCFHFLC